MPSTNTTAEEVMPCPVCLRKHSSREFYEDDQGRYKPSTVKCDCGAVLQFIVPFIAQVGDPYGWHWSIVPNEKARVIYE